MFNLSKKFSKIQQFVTDKEIEIKGNDTAPELKNIINYLLNRQNMYEVLYNCLEKSFIISINNYSNKDQEENINNSDNEDTNKQEL